MYKRPEHTRGTLASLGRCLGAARTDLHIFADGPKTAADQDAVAQVRAACRAATGFRSVTVQEAPVNRGLAASVIAGVSQVLDRADACIAVEDDLSLAPGFLDFLNGGLQAYREAPRVFSLSGYAPPPSRVPVEPPGSVWFAPRPCSWGWAVWKDRWHLIDWDAAPAATPREQRQALRRLEAGGRDLSYFLRLQARGTIDSWAVRMAWSQSRREGLTVYPTRSFVDNRGLDGSGTHSRAEGPQDIDLTQARVPDQWPEPAEAPARVLRAFRRHYEGTWAERWQTRWQKAQRLLGGRG